MQVVHTKGQRVRTFLVHTPYKKVVKSLCYKNPSYTARSMLRIPLLKQSTLAEVTKICTSYGEGIHLQCRIKLSPIGCESRMFIIVYEEASFIFISYDHTKTTVRV